MKYCATSNPLHSKYIFNTSGPHCREIIRAPDRAAPRRALPRCIPYSLRSCQVRWTLLFFVLSYSSLCLINILTSIFCRHCPCVAFLTIFSSFVCFHACHLEVKITLLLLLKSLPLLRTAPRNPPKSTRTWST